MEGVDVNKATRTPEQRFDAKVSKTATCWLWTGCTDPGGYGMVTIHKVLDRVHRVAYRRWKGAIPDGMKIDHMCGVRACVNPEHLRLVTDKQNAEHRTRPNSNSKSGIRGVTWYPNYSKWVARVRHDGRSIHVGYFDTSEQAETAVIEVRNRLFTHNDRDRVPA